MANSPFEIPGWSRPAAPWLATLWLAATLTTSGCLFQKKPRAFVPPVLPPPKPVAFKPVAMVDAAPEIEATLNPTVELFSVAAWVDLQLPPPPKPAVPARRPTPPPPTQVKVAPPEAPPVAPPKISQILSPQESNNLIRAFDDSMGRVDRALTELAKKNLGASDRDTVGLIQSFQTQARQAREQDLVTAVGLAKRADVLAKDLLGRLP